MDLDAMLQPLGGASPCGDDLSFSPEFDAIGEARRFDDPSLDQGAWVTEIKQADWPAVARLCGALLTDRTKDLRLAVWLAEALTNTHGPQGLAQGYRLVSGLCERYWDHLHPLPEGGDPEQRVGNLDWLLSRSGRMLRELPLTRSTRGAYSSLDLDAARSLAQAVERRPDQAEALLQDAAVTQARFDAALADTPREFLAANLAGARAASAALHELQAVVERHLGADGPNFAPARAALGEFEATLASLAAAVGADQPPADPATADPHPVPELQRPEAPGRIGNRAQALQQLRQVAEFFRRTEPHSPVAYLADKAARWGEMPLHEWLRTVVKDDGALAHVEELLGVLRTERDTGHG